MKRIAIYPGSFDPVTNGHIDIITRATHLFDKVVVAVSVNHSKDATFTISERVVLLKSSLKHLMEKKVVEVDYFKGLLVSYAKKKNACAVIRGLRAVSDFEYEFQMTLMNRHQNKKIETVFLMPDEKYTYLSSRLVKEIILLGGKTKDFLPKPAIKSIYSKLLGSK